MIHFHRTYFLMEMTAEVNSFEDSRVSISQYTDSACGVQWCLLITTESPLEPMHSVPPPAAPATPGLEHQGPRPP